MKIRRLQIEEMTLPRISVDTTMARISVHAPIRRIKTIHGQHPRMTVSRENPKIEVDMESLRNNIGMKSSATLIQDQAAKARAQSTQGIKDIENAGDAMAAIPHSGNPVAAIALAKITRMAPNLQGSGRAVDPTVDIKGYKGTLSIDWSIQDISISWEEYQQSVITVDPKPSVEITLTQPGHMKFIVVEQSIPPEKGRSIDEEV